MEKTNSLSSDFPYSCDYNDPLLAELYDQSITDIADVELIRTLIGESSPLKILECFIGTGRILIPLAKDGHIVTGIEFAHAMHERAVTKICELKPEIRSRITLKVQDVLKGTWGKDYDVIIMGANALYELPSAKAQEKCIKVASKALVSGGNLFIDNDDQKKPLTKENVGESWIAFKGKGNDGTYGEMTAKIIDVDVEEQIQYIERRWYKKSPDGTENLTKYMARKHPVSSFEVEAWLNKYSFKILCELGDRQGTPYTKDSERAIFWTQKTS
jgi:hypothetical protein